MTDAGLSKSAGTRDFVSIRGAVTPREAVAAARARVAADKLRGVQTDERIIRLSERKES